MADSTARDTLRLLLKAAVEFENKAANHKRIESERRALAEAITQAQLVLSVAPQEPSPSRRDRPQEKQEPKAPRLRSIPGGRPQTAMHSKSSKRLKRAKR